MECVAQLDFLAAAGCDAGAIKMEFSEMLVEEMIAFDIWEMMTGSNLCFRVEVKIASNSSRPHVPSSKVLSLGIMTPD